MAKTLVVMAAGTGGHVIPGLAVAEEMRQRGWQVHWLGTSHGMENKLVPPHRIPMTTLHFSGLRGKGLVHSLTGVFKLIGATVQAWRLLGRITPNVVLGMGGYVTVPGGWATRLRQVPMALVNADAGLLLSNRALANAAEVVMFGFESAAQAELGAKAVVTGNPVRAEIAALPIPSARFANRQGRLQMLVVGGSLGAQVLNTTVPKALALLPASERPSVIHQSGAQHVDALKQAYLEAGVDATVLPFIDDMAKAYGDADLMICRAGAITVSELTVAGVPSVLVPFVASTTAHQTDNAKWMAEHGAAVHLPQTELTPQRLAEVIRNMGREKLLEMANSARALARPNATKSIAETLERIALA